MQAIKLLYEGKAKKIFETQDPQLRIMEFKDDATAFNGQKKGSIHDKGKINNKVSAALFELLESSGVKTHFVKILNDRNMLVKAVEIIPLEVIVRNIVAGSMAKRFGIEEGKRLHEPVLEFSYKNDELGDPMMNRYHALALGLATREEIDYIEKTSLKVNEILRDFFASKDILLVDFKLEYGRFGDEILLADEISPDTCRFWDAKTMKKLDKDRFRRDLGDIEQAYLEILERISK